MPKRNLTSSERLVGRARPKDPTYRDGLLAGFLNERDEPIGRTNPSDRWLIPAFTKLRKEGLIRMGVHISLGGRAGPTDGVWYLREGDRPLAEARAAKARVKEAREAFDVWAGDLQGALAAARNAYTAIRGRFGTAEEAQEWITTEPVPGYGEMTAKELIDNGRADEVLEFIESVDAGISA